MSTSASDSTRFYFSDTDSEPPESNPNSCFTENNLYASCLEQSTEAWKVFADFQIGSARDGWVDCPHFRKIVTVFLQSLPEKQRSEAKTYISRRFREIGDVRYSLRDYGSAISLYGLSIECCRSFVSYACLGVAWASEGDRLLNETSKAASFKNAAIFCRKAVKDLRCSQRIHDLLEWLEDKLKTLPNVVVPLESKEDEPFESEVFDDDSEAFVREWLKSVI